MAAGSATTGIRPALRAVPWLTVLRRGAPVAYGVFVLVQALRGELPLSKDVLLLWIAGFVLACSITSPRRFLRGVVVDWLPLAGVLMIYDLLRGVADGLIFEARTLPQLQFDEVLFGGQTPTVFLQEHLWNGAADLRWWDWAALAVYITHFFFTLTLAALLWAFAHHLFRRYMAKICVLSLAGFATYALFPAVPPWMASETGHLPEVTRIVPIAWSHVHLFSFDTLFESGSKYANDVAAMPSLHAAFAMLVSITLWGMARWWWVRVVLAIYPLVMGFALVYGGEHYVADVLAGFLYAAATVWVVERVARRLDERRARIRATRARPEPAPAARS